MTRLESRLSGHQVSTNFPPDLPLVLVDGVLMEQVLINLLENAIKFCPPSSAIELSATGSDRELLFDLPIVGLEFHPAMNSASSINSTGLVRRVREEWDSV